MPFAETISCSFPYTYLTSTSRYVSTDLSLVPALSNPLPSQLACVGTAFVPAVSVGSKWHSPQYSTSLKSRATSAACLYADTTASANNEILWTTLSAMNSVDPTSQGGRMFSDVSAYDSFASTSGIQSSSSFTREKSQYGDSDPPPEFFTDGNGNTYFRADAGVYCAGSLRLRTVSSTNGYSYNQVIASDYLGSSPSGYTAPNVATPGTVEFRVDLDLSRCIAAGRTYINTATCPSSQASVYLYKRCENTVAHTASSNTLSVTFENPFACSATVANAAPNPVNAAPGTSFAMSFNFVNSAIRAIRVDSIALSTESKQWFDETGTTFTLPSGDIAANGGTGAVSGTVKVKPGIPTGTYPLNLSIAYHSTQADCAGSNSVSCNSPHTLILQVNVVSNQTCTLSFVNSVPGNNIAPGASQQIRAVCQNPSDCPALTWSHTAGAQATLAPQNTPSGVNPQSTLSVIMAATPHNGYAVNATNGTLVCAGLPFNVAIPSNLPNYVIPAISNPEFVYVGEAFNSAVTTSNIGNSAATVQSTTNVTFNSQLRQIAINPLAAGAAQAGTVSFTCPSTNGTYAETAYADATKAILESNESDNTNSSSVVCYRKPTGCNCGIVNHDIDFNRSDSAQVNATCFDQYGPLPCPRLTWSHNATGNVTLAPTQTARGWSPSSTLTIGANAPAQLNRAVVAVSAEPAVVPLSCGPAPFNVNPYSGTYALGCNFAGYGTNPAFFAGQQVTALANCMKDGSPACPGLNWSVSLPSATLQPNATSGVTSPQQSQLRMSSTEPSSVLQGNVTIKCSDPIECTASISCQFRFSPTPNNMTCGCVGRLPNFSPNDWALMQANCTKIGLAGQVACPELTWETNITSANFTPNPTPANISPTTNFTTKNAPVPQSGYIDATGTAGMNTLHCANPVLTSVDNYGPDYTVVWVKAPTYMIEPGTTFHVSVNVTNIGNVNVTTTVTQTALLGANCSSTNQLRGTNPLNVGKSAVFEDYTCICETAGTFSVTAVADSGNQLVGELNKNNNRGSGTYVCGLVYAPTCFDYI